MKAVIDSCAWIELLVDGPNTVVFQRAMAQASAVVVPVVCLHEVHRYIGAHFGEAEADGFAQSLQAHEVMGVDADLALEGARLGRKHKLALADSLVYASALRCGAELWTQDADFKGLVGVRYHPKRKPKA